MMTPFLPGIVALQGGRDDGIAKRARDGDLTILEEAEARGWSSAMSERSLALRRRRGLASSSSPRVCGWVAATAEEFGCRRQEAAAADPIGSGAADEEAVLVDPSCFAWFCVSDLSELGPPPMAGSFMLVTDPLLPPDRVILEARKDDCAAAAATEDDHDCSCDVAVTADAVDVDAQASAKETAVVDPYLYFCLTL